MVRFKYLLPKQEAIVKNEQGLYCCSECDFSTPHQSSVFRHFKTMHNKVVQTSNGNRRPDPYLKREQIRLRVEAFRAKTQPRKTRASTKKKQNGRFTEEDAEERGAHQCKNALVEYRESTIPGAGNGVFACVNLYKNDIVTWYTGKWVPDNSKNEGYTIRLNSGGYMKGITKPKKGKGLGSFINREERRMHRKLKNCDFLEKGYPDHNLYVVVTKKIRAGEELLTTYDRNYKINKKK